MIGKILDKYYAKKAVYLMWHKILILNIEGEFREEKGSYCLYIKKRKYADKYFKKFWDISFKDGFDAYMRIFEMNSDELCKHAELILKEE